MRKPASIYPETQLIADPPFEALYTPSYELGAPGYKYSQNWIGATARGFGVTGWGFAKDQWAGAFDREYEPVSAEELETIPDNELVDFKPWMNRGQVERQIEMTKRQQYIDAHRASWYHHVAGFVGALPTIMLSPEVLVTLPVGGPAFTAATRAPTLVGMAGQSLKAGAQVSAASIPANIIAQQMTYGRVDNTELALVAAAPFALSPLTAAGFRSYLRRGAGKSADNGTASGIPPQMEANFDNYQGGLKGWLDDFMQNNVAAVTYAQSIGLGEEALTNFRAIALEQANRTAAGAADVALQQDLQALVFGQAGPDQLERLVATGALPDTPEMADLLARYAALENVGTLESVALLRELADTLPPELQGVVRHMEYIRLGRNGPDVDDMTIKDLQDTLVAIDSGDLTNVRPEYRPFAETMLETANMPPFDRKLMNPANDDALDALRRVASSGDQEAARKVLARALGRMNTESDNAIFKAFRDNGLDGARLAYMKQLENEVEIAVRTLGQMDGAARVAYSQTQSLSAKLPAPLAKAAPRYKNFQLMFESDIDRAAYITAQSKPSKRDADYLKFVMEAEGMTEDQVRAHGARVREFIGTQERNAVDETIPVPAQTVRNSQRELPETILPEQQAMRDETFARIEALKAEQTRLANARTNVPPEFNIEDLARALLSSRQQARPATMSDVGPMPVTASSRVLDPSEADKMLAAWAERNGVDFDSPSSAALRVERIIEECGQ